jgi:hypothetical protein
VALVESSAVDEEEAEEEEARLPVGAVVEETEEDEDMVLQGLCDGAALEEYVEDKPEEEVGDVDAQLDREADTVAQCERTGELEFVRLPEVEEVEDKGTEPLRLLEGVLESDGEIEDVRLTEEEEVMEKRGELLLLMEGELVSDGGVLNVGQGDGESETEKHADLDTDSVKDTLEVTRFDGGVALDEAEAEIDGERVSEAEDTCDAELLELGDARGVRESGARAARPK